MLASHETTNKYDLKCARQRAKSTRVNANDNSDDDDQDHDDDNKSNNRDSPSSQPGTHIVLVTAARDESKLRHCFAGSRRGNGVEESMTVQTYVGSKSILAGPIHWLLDGNFCVMKMKPLLTTAAAAMASTITVGNDKQRRQCLAIGQREKMHGSLTREGHPSSIPNKPIHM